MAEWLMAGPSGVAWRSGLLHPQPMVSLRVSKQPCSIVSLYAPLPSVPGSSWSRRDPAPASGWTEQEQQRGWRVSNPARPSAPVESNSRGDAGYRTDKYYPPTGDQVSSQENRLSFLTLILRRDRHRQLPINSRMRIARCYQRKTERGCSR